MTTRLQAGLLTMLATAAIANSGGDAGAQDEPPGPAAAALIEPYIGPRTRGLSAAALALQNAVVRVCTAPTEEAEQALHRAFETTLLAASHAAAIGASGPEALDAPARILTSVADTAFSRSALNAIIEGPGDVPETLAALEPEGAALRGLPALEVLLLRAVDSASAPVANAARRCAMASTVAASIRIDAVRMERAWARGTIDAHWNDPSEPFAGRQRLRDLVEGIIATVDRMDRTLSAFLVNPKDNDALPFRAPERVEALLVAMTGGLIEQTRAVRRFVSSGSQADAVLAGVDAALAEGQRRISAPVASAERAAAFAPFETAEALVIERLPETLGFAPSAFRRPIAAFDLKRPRSSETLLPVPATEPTAFP